MKIFYFKKEIEGRQMKIFLLAIVFLFSIVINNDKLRAETVGHFYWHLPSIRFNSNTSLLPGTGTGTGFHVAAGNLKKPAHLADIGLQYYSQSPHLRQILQQALVLQQSL